MLVADNLELGCSIIERAATDKAVRDIDKNLTQAYEARARARAQRQPFFDPAMFAQGGRFPAALPDSLKPKPGMPQQQRVYEDFARMPRALPPHGLQPGFRPDGAPPASPLQVRTAGAGMCCWREPCCCAAAANCCTAVCCEPPQLPVAAAEVQPQAQCVSL